MKIPHIAPLLNYSLYGVICDNKANSARVELGLGLSLAINELKLPLHLSTGPSAAYQGSPCSPLWPNIPKLDDECFWPIYSRCCSPVYWAFLAILEGMLPSTVLSVSGLFIANASNQCTRRFWPFCSVCCQQCDWPNYRWCCQPVWWAWLAIFMLITLSTVGSSGYLYTDAAISFG